MEQVWITRFGGPEVLEVRSAPDPHPGPDEVRVAVAAAGVNFADVSARAGLYPDAPKAPCVVGYEVSGVVDEVGAAVDDFVVGDRALALTRFNGYSTSVIVPAHQVQRVPEGKDLQAAAGLPVTFLTAYLMLTRMGALRRGDRVLIHAAAGGVGLAALQLARHVGAVTIGTASAAKHERLRDLGLDYPIDYRTNDFEPEVMRITDGRGVDLVLDAVGGTTTRKSYRCLAPLGRLFCFGLSSASAPSRRQAWRTAPKAFVTTPVFHPLQLMNANKGVFGFNLGHLWEHTELLHEAMGDIVTLWGKGEIDVIVDSTFPFRQTAAAHAQLEQARNFGKVLLLPETSA
jgi:synaptic vesicle membrane protein VAT-1